MPQLGHLARNVLSIPAKRKLMDNRTLSFSDTGLSRLRKLIAVVDKEIALIPGATTPNSLSPRTALDIAWSNLVATLDLGAEPGTEPEGA
jgi:hypothetical protein